MLVVGQQLEEQPECLLLEVVRLLLVGCLPSSAKSDWLLSSPSFFSKTCKDKILSALESDQICCLVLVSLLLTWSPHWVLSLTIAILQPIDHAILHISHSVKLLLVIEVILASLMSRHLNSCVKMISQTWRDELAISVSANLCWLVLSCLKYQWLNACYPQVVVKVSTDDSISFVLDLSDKMFFTSFVWLRNSFVSKSHHISDVITLIRCLVIVFLWQQLHLFAILVLWVFLLTWKYKCLWYYKLDLKGDWAFKTFVKLLIHWMKEPLNWDSKK